MLIPPHFNKKETESQRDGGALPSDTQPVAELRLGTTEASNSPMDKPGLVAGSEWHRLCPLGSPAVPGHCPVPRGLGWAGLGPLGSTHIRSP